MTDTWRGTYSERFLDRAIQRPPRPSPAPIYRRLTDEEIAALPDAVRPMALLSRSFTDAAARNAPAIRAAVAAMSRSWESKP